MYLKHKISAMVAKRKGYKDGCRNKYLSIVGCFLILMNNGVFWFWGNMSVYCMSYFVSVLNSDSDVESPWIYSCYVILWTLGCLLSGAIAERIGRPFTTLLGAVIFNTGVFCSYFTVRTSLAALTVTIGVATGLGTGLMDGSGLQLGIDWGGKRIALLTGILQGSLSFGGFLINQLITRYTNPRNLTPNFYLSPTKYFTQKEVLERVPSMFLVLGCYCSCLHLIGFSMLREKPPASKEAGKVTYNSSEKTALVQNNTRQNGEKRCMEVKDSSPEIPFTTEKEKHLAETGDNIDYTYKQMLKTKSFYTCWGCFFVCAMPIMLASVYYKTFGQLWIKDDYFMTNIATLMSIGNTVVCGVLGFLIDSFGAKNSNVFATGVMSLVLFWYYFTPMMSKWLYMVTVLVFVCLSGPVFSSYTAITALLYGKKHFSTNFGIIMTSQLVFNLISPYFVGYLLTSLGWFAIYTFTGAILTMSLLPMIFFIPNV